MKCPKLAAALATLAVISGCASIVEGENQQITIRTSMDGWNVTGASCKLTNSKGNWFTTSPGTVTVPRAYDDLRVACDKSGLAGGTLTVKSSTKGMAFGNILAGGPVGAGVDVGTGAAYDYPSNLTVRMGMDGTAVLRQPALPYSYWYHSTD
ncbi:hypothetical protein AWB81_08252 [Caballeronia arationis]|uniref:hypothetical protein n=1 Tax=Caballeronia arationis TaxID=1777142 RepID=UPI00074B8369|nr:hypothetical protein [Caballeronia arationis]SAL07720.1 hypothetical protein AWB81_08252 [Caballeronia arationis]